MKETHSCCQKVRQPMKQITKNRIAFTILLICRGLVVANTLFSYYGYRCLKAIAKTQLKDENVWTSLGKSLGSSAYEARQAMKAAAHLSVTMALILVVLTFVEYFSFRKQYHIGGPIPYQLFWILTCLGLFHFIAHIFV